MSLSDSCDRISVLHEIGHVLGLTHEHQHPNREGYLSMNINAYELAHNKYPEIFDKIIYNHVRDKGEIEGHEKAFANKPFDENSIMIYHSYPRNHFGLRDLLKENNQPLYLYKQQLSEAGEYVKYRIVPRPQGCQKGTLILLTNSIQDTLLGMVFRLFKLVNWNPIWCIPVDLL